MPLQYIESCDSLYRARKRRSRSAPMVRGGFICRDTCAKQPAVRVRQPSAPIAASLPRRQPVVTLRAGPISAGFSSRYSPWRNPVMSSLAHHTIQPRNAVRPSARSRRASFDPARNPRTPEPWVMAQLDGLTSHRKRHRSQCRVPRRQAAKQTARTGSGVPRPS